ncbi:hypothetical protein ABZ801_19940 [Actinomadura sp. NPDC047616]|uniref:hypothetical protein n=1 Tax=Actinomadura sp. NPDC047616 TaxID=3155914 RepID=UPI0033F858F9
MLQADRNAFDKYWLAVMLGVICLVMLYVASRHARRGKRPLPIPAEFAAAAEGDATATWPDVRKGSP